LFGRKGPLVVNIQDDEFDMFKIKIPDGQMISPDFGQAVNSPTTYVGSSPSPNNPRYDGQIESFDQR
jgi:hypothetical protein